MAQPFVNTENQLKSFQNGYKCLKKESYDIGIFILHLLPQFL